MKNCTTQRAQLFFEAAEQHSFPLIIVCYEFKNPQNVGAVLRLAGNFGAERVIVCSDDFQMRKRKINPTATTAINTVNWAIMDSKACFEALPSDYTIIGVETAENAVPIANFSFPEKCVIIVGNEGFGLPEMVLERCHHVIYLDLPGSIKSMNVSHALCATLYDWFLKRKK